MAGYRALARKYRPQNFEEVLGQEAIVITLKNSISQNRLSHAYLFAGSRGTGKTTLARILARAVNCSQRPDGVNPCNHCSACKEALHGASLDLLEIDGASHRGIEDIRQLNETVGYAPAGGQYKVYLIDEVHMLTKEAFNALLKTLEEPPPKVIFLFATTEPHKVPATILSRCQQFHLNHLDDQLICEKLRREAQEAGTPIDEETLSLICQRADGSMRDAESLLDQLLSFHGENLEGKIAAAALGLAPMELFFQVDAAADSQSYTQAYRVADQVIGTGKSILHFVEGLIRHYRNRLLLHLGLEPRLSPSLRKQYEETQAIFNRDHCLLLIDELLPALESIKGAVSPRLTLEGILLRILRVRQRMPLDQLVSRLLELEGRLSAPAQGEPAEEVVAEVEKEDRDSAPPSESKSREGILKQQNRYNTILRFAALELDGTLQ
jgi:DNA polymerase III subunit gamma/tau